MPDQGKSDIVAATIIVYGVSKSIKRLNVNTFGVGNTSREACPPGFLSNLALNMSSARIHSSKSASPMPHPSWVILTLS